MLILILPPLSPCPNSLLSRTYLYTPNKNYTLYIIHYSLKTPTFVKNSLSYEDL